MFIDPTGTYQLGNMTPDNSGEIYGHFGQIQVIKIMNDKIVMTFEFNKGAPSYNSGSFVDTLTYRDNKSVYTDFESDSTCKVYFVFDKRGVSVDEITADFNMGCGFGHGVVASGYYKKISNKTPILTEPLTGEKIKK